MKPSRRALLVLAVLVGAAGLCLAAEPPVVVLLDTSRSVKPPEFVGVTAKLAEALRSLPAESTSGLLEFNDAPVWTAPVGVTPSAVAEALKGVKTGGKHTLLLDAIATSVRDLSAGGVVLLVTDGKDEGSVATVADVGALCSVRHVRILTVALGAKPDVRTLQRLALLTGGRHLGPVAKLRAADLGQALMSARQELQAAIPEPVSAPPPVSAAQPVTAAAPAPTEPARPSSEGAATSAPAENAPSSFGILPVVVGILVAIALVVVFVVWRSRKAGSERVCPDCGHPMASWENNCSNCAIERLQLRQAESAAGVAPPAEALQPEVEIFDASEFAKLPTEERLEKTFSLEEHAVLIVRQQRRPVRTFALDPTKVIHAGRAGTVNTVAIDDPSVSGQHFKIVPKDGEFFILDLDSTNGVYVNGERVKVHKLKSGDTVMAGQVECEFRMQFVRRV